jgi:hypothetical protein
LHALQNVQQHLQDAYGKDYQTMQPEAERLKRQIYDSFASATPALAQERYAAVLALCTPYVQAQPEAQTIFDFLDRHWPTLVNAIGSDLIPTSHNTVERVSAGFDQHYQNCCGFESILDAQRYLAVCEKGYRFTPFSQDAQPAVRGKAHCNWRVTLSASCRWLPSVPAVAPTGPRRPPMSLARDALA